MDLGEQRKHIFHKITTMRDTSDIYHIVDGMDIPKTRNANGIFMNLSALSPEDIRILYGVMETIHIHKEESLPEVGVPFGNPETNSFVEDISPNYHEVKTPIPKKMKLTRLQRRILAILN